MSDTSESTPQDDGVDASQQEPPEATDATPHNPGSKVINLSKLIRQLDRVHPYKAVDFTKFTGLPKGVLLGVDFTKFTGLPKGVLPKVDFTKLTGLPKGALPGLTLDKTLGLKPAHQLLGVDFAKMTGGARLARISTGIDFTKFAGSQKGALAGVDFTKLAGLQKRAMAGVDFSAFTAGFDFSKITQALELAGGFAALYPRNWPGDVDLDRVAEVIADDGIPLVWVPRESVVAELLEAPDRPARLAILVKRTSELVEDCRLVLTSIDEPTLADQLPLAQAALESYAGGHHEAAQALATVVTETVIAGALPGRYTKVQEAVLFDPAKVTWRQLRLKAALAPIHRFYTSWYRKTGQPAPEALSRHVTVHEAHTGHFSSSNALVAVLLVTSVMRAIQELQERNALLDKKVGTAA